MKKCKITMALSLATVLCLVACGGDDTTGVSGNGNGGAGPVVDPSTVYRGQFVNEKDGMVYRMVTIGSQTWMADDLGRSRYDSDAQSLSRFLKGFYSYTDARDACPAGWHLPDAEEWKTLFRSVGGDSVAGKMLKPTANAGEDAYGFSASLAGRSGFCNDGNMICDLNLGYYWVRYGNGGYGEDLVFFGPADALWFTSKAPDATYRIRCIKDEAYVPANPAVSYGQLIDERDGQVYATINIGLTTWMAQNLNYDAEGSHCNQDDLNNCALYGRRYMVPQPTTNVMMSQCYSPEMTEFCPAGWHVSTNSDWDDLLWMTKANSDPKILKAVSWTDSDGSGLDSFGFSALPADDGKSFATFWSSTCDSSAVYSVRINSSGLDAIGQNFVVASITRSRQKTSNTMAYSVRCVKSR